MTYGEYPKELIFHMFRIDQMIHIPFVQDDMETALQWFVNTIHLIEEDEDFWDIVSIEYEQEQKPLAAYKRDRWFCNWLCNSKQYCPRSKFYMEDFE